MLIQLRCMDHRLQNEWTIAIQLISVNFIRSVRALTGQMDLGQVSVHRLKDLDRNYLSVIICNYLRLTVILSVSQSVCKHSYGRNFDSILMKFSQWFGAQKVRSSLFAIKIW